MRGPTKGVLCLVAWLHGRTVVIAILLALVTPRAHGAAEDPGRFAEVEEWTLTYSFESDDPYRYQEERSTTVVNRSVFREHQSGTIHLRRSGKAQFKGEAPVAASCEWMQETRGGNSVRFEEAKGNGTPMARASLFIDLQKGTYNLSVMPQAMNLAKHMTLRDEGRLLNEARLDMAYRPTVLPFPVKHKNHPTLPATGMVISGSYSREDMTREQDRDPEKARRNTLKSGPAIGKGSWRLVPKGVSEPELVVRVTGVEDKGRETPYAEWIPRGSARAENPGGRLRVTARLQSRDKGPVAAQPKRVRFELRGTSREPGVCMNWPNLLGPGDKVAPDVQFDLRFDGRSGPTDAKRQVQTVIPTIGAGGSPEAEAWIESFDFGAWADLVVTAELADGRELTGHLDGEPDLQVIPLPKRSGGSLIADAWKKQENIAIGARDDADDEKAPAGEPGCDGDGLTLYEEYRGFLENGRHVRGDPRRKDLFIYNACGAVALPGIALFQRLTGLVVHKGLREDERNYQIPGDHTAINGYFDKGPHRVLQHRVEILVCGVTRDHGGGVRTKDPGAAYRHLRPKDVENVFVEGPGLRFWEEQYGVSEADRPRQFDAAMAHELLHTVGVEHHGEGDSRLKIEAHSDGLPAYANARWEIYGESTKPRLFHEATGTDITESSARRAVKAGDARTSMPMFLGPAVENPWDVQNMHVGHENGQGSGNTDCVMRYWIADAYPRKGAKDSYYLVRPGTEPVGTTICSSTQGTSINAPRKPQPRYFDAAPKRGNCRSWICVNDAIPGKSSGIP
jgi:hypothetical protein